MAAHDSHMRLQGGNESESRRKCASSGANELSGQFSKLCSVIPISVQNGRRQKCHKIQNNLLPYSPMNLKWYYKFLITDVLLNAWEENRIDIHI